MDDLSKARALVAAQFAALGALAAPARPRRKPGALRRATGTALVVGGGALASAGALALGRDLRPLPIPRAGAQVRVRGPYALTRHPIYAGILLAAAGRWLVTGARRHGWAGLALAGVFAAKVRFEEKLLDDVEGYRSYQSSVPRWGLGRRSRA